MVRAFATAPRRAAALLFAAVLWLVLAGTTLAQTAPAYDIWDRFASQVEQALDGNKVSDDTLQQMRARAVDWRTQFAAAQNSRSTRVATLRDQIAALGPAPAEGKTEPEDVAARRKELEAELSVEQAPALRATEAYGRADGLVTQIDKTLRDRQKSEVLRLSPSPLLPASWQAAASDGGRVTENVAAELAELYGETGRQGLLQSLPAVLALLGFALLLLTYGRRWVEGLPARLARRSSDSARGAVAFVASLAQILLPVLGVWLVLLAIDATGLVGPWIGPLLEGAALAGLTFFLGLWLARQLFPLDPARPALMALTTPRRERARRQATLLAGTLALRQLIAMPLLPLTGIVLEADPASVVPQRFGDAGAGVIHLALILLAAFPLFRLGNLLRKVPADTNGTRERAFGALASLVRVVAVGAPLAAAAGYVSAANAVIWPTAMTLAVAGVIVLLQQFIADLWQMLNKRKEGAADSLVPVLVGFLLVLAAVPLLALIWGARVSDLAEVWTRLANGFQIGTVRLSPGGILTFLLIFAVGYMLTRAAQGALRTSVLPRTRIEKGAQNAIVSGLGYVGIFLAAVLAISAAGFDLSSFAIVAGALSVGIGFGMQNIVSNFVSGIILLIERPVTVGDWIQVGSAQGYVRRISVRSTTIQTFDRTDVVVPNSDLITQQVTNWTRGSLTGRIIVPVSVAYGSDTRKVAALLKEIAENQPTVLIDPAPQAVFTGFGANSLDFEIRAILSDINQGLSVSSEIRHQVAERLAEDGIDMPFPQRDIWLRNPEVLAEAVVSAEKPPQRQPPKQPGPAERADGLDPRIAASAASGIEGMPDHDGDADGPAQG